MARNQHPPMIARDSQPMSRQPGRYLRWLAHQSLGTTATAALENELKPKDFVPAHTHEVEELLLCRAGRGAISLDGVVYPFESGHTVVVPPGCIHGFHNTGDECMRVLAFFPTADPSAHWVESRYAGNAAWAGLTHEGKEQQ